MTKRHLVLFTAEFPYGTGETFLESEIIYLAEGFDEIRIISLNSKDPQTRSLPSNCVVERLDLQISKKDKFRSLFQIFSSKFWQEKQIIKSVYRLKMSKRIFSTLLISLYRAKRVERKVLELIKSSKNVQQFFYSYWCDDVAIGLALASEKNRGLNTFCRIHRWDVYFDQSAVGYLPLRHYITANLKTVFSISQDGIDYAKQVWKTGLDNKFQLSRLGIRNDYPLKKVERDHFLLVSCSNLIPVKRVHLIADALQTITDQRIHWVHIGDGSDLKQIEEKINRFPANITVELKGRSPNPAIYAYYNEVRPDLFINISSSEGVPVSIMEAMSMGIPVIATNVGGNSEIVNNENGILLSANPSLQEIATALTRFYEMSDEEYTYYSHNAYLTWNEKYNAEKNYKAFIKLIQN